VVLDLDRFPDTSLKPVVSNRVVVKPPLGVLFAELLDSYGRVPHAGRKYKIDGPMQFEGTTDENGQLFHDSVFPGDYTLQLESEFDIGNGPETELLEAPLVVLPALAPRPQLRMIGAVPRVVLSRLRGLFFETNKSFLLPAAHSVFDRVRDVYRANNPAELLIVGHADTTAEPAINDPLSLERAKNTRAFLEDDVDTWLAMYETSVPEGRRWGANEDHLMLSSLEDFPRRPSDDDPVRWFQRTRRLEVDGDAGPKTRRVLIGEYMALDHASLVGDDFRITSRAHGCGENFPLEDTGSELDPAPQDPKPDQLDRRVELFFFDTEFGIQPPPPGDNSGPGSAQYPSWRKRAILDLDVLLDGKRELLLVDEMGVALCFEPFEIETQDGRVIAGEANADGVVVFPPGLGSRVTLRLTAMSSETSIEVGFR
jgi:outer membrane protein OmpA-like peptidoglycan-associated protein